MLILVDQDGVLADYDAGFDTGWAAAYPTWPQPPVGQRTRFYIEDAFPADQQPHVGPIQRTPGFFRNLPAIPGAITALHEMLETGHDVRICTAPLKDYKHCIREKYEWVEEHLGIDWCARMMPTRDKTIVVGDILIDDRPDIHGIITPSWTHIAYTQAYNATLTVPRITWGNHLDVLDQIEADRIATGRLILPRH